MIPSYAQESPPSLKEPFEITGSKQASQICWTEAEDQIIEQGYKTKTFKQLHSLLPSRTFNGLANRITHLCLGGRLQRKRKKNFTINKLPFLSKKRNWTAPEDRILKDNYAIKPLQEIATLLQDRSVSSIRGRAKQLNITKTLHNFWTPSEDQILIDHYAIKNTEDIATLLQNRSVDSINRRAKKLKIAVRNLKIKKSLQDDLVKSSESFTIKRPKILPLSEQTPLPSLNLEDQQKNLQNEFDNDSFDKDKFVSSFFC